MMRTPQDIVNQALREMEENKEDNVCIDPGHIDFSCFNKIYILAKYKGLVVVEIPDGKLIFNRKKEPDDVMKSISARWKQILKKKQEEEAE